MLAAVQPVAVLHGDSHGTETDRRETTDDIVPGYEPSGTPCAVALSAFTLASRASHWLPVLHTVYYPPPGRDVRGERLPRRGRRTRPVFGSGCLHGSRPPDGRPLAKRRGRSSVR